MKRPQKKLVLSRHTLRQLAGDDLQGAAGGAPSGGSPSIRVSPTDPVPWLPGPSVISGTSVIRH